VVLDIAVPAVVLRYATLSGTFAGAETACAADPNPFTGAELLGAVYGLPADGWQQQCAATTVAAALAARGAVVVNPAGRCAVVVAPGRVVQPAGRVWAVCPADLGDWTAGWVPAGLVVTG
jgi:hypothetical protein